MAVGISLVEIVFWGRREGAFFFPLMIVHGVKVFPISDAT